MVVQRDFPVHLWGWAAAGEQVTAAFRGAQRSTVANELGQWSLYLPPSSAGGPFDLTIKGTNTITLDDVLVGDVWLAGGQSNMEFEMRKASTAAEDLPKAGNPRIRLMIVKKHYADFPQTDLETTTPWTASTPDSAREFSAVAWYFAREISERENIPIGVIDSTWGGTVAEAWTRLTALGEDASLAPVFTARGHMTEREATALLEQNLHDQQSAGARAQGKPEPPSPWHPILNMWGPSMLWNGMIAPLTPFPIRGVLWYQGESNSALERAPLYQRLFPTLVTDWRRQWQIGDFPFLFVQIANFKSTPKEDWPTIREAQLRTLHLRNTGMAVTIDIGNPDDVHPKDKRTVGHRLALAARNITYGEPQLEASGPTFRQVTTEANNLRLWFDHADGLQAKDGALTGFEIAGPDGVFVPADAHIDGKTILLSSPAVATPTTARYGWANNPECHLYNSAGLPASPFTTAP
ncbi:MAG TPA: sialate O-acetylesterase [Acidobacteriaceae bacterium]|nr:sialate O-acetylesterase [Acidobacteriaceae bacterium]